MGGWLATTPLYNLTRERKISSPKAWAVTNRNEEDE